MNKQIDPNTKTIRFPVPTSNRLQTIADKCGMTRLDCFAAMVDYFYKSKKDPRDLNDELLKKELVKRTDTIIGFIRTTEDELLRPLITSTGKIDTNQYKIVQYFNQHIITHNKEQKEAYAQQQATLKSVSSSMQRIERAQEDKALLKIKFSKILEYYIKAREAMSMITKQAEKDALNQNIRQQLQNL
jgi:hypothetical protein